MSEARKFGIEFRLWGRYALFSDPINRVGGEKCSYHIPTYEALKGVAKSIYWKPTFIWIIDEVRMMKSIRTQTKGVKPIKVQGGNSLAIYTFLADVEYQVKAHFEWNEHRPELAADRSVAKHVSIADRALKRGGRQDVFLGTRDCQGYVEPCVFGEGAGAFDGAGDMLFGPMFHGFDYPDETGRDDLTTRFFAPTMTDGVVKFPRPEACTMTRYVRPMHAKTFSPGVDFEICEPGTESA